MNKQEVNGREIRAVTTVTVFLLLYIIFIHFESTYFFGSLMLLFSPFLIFWMVFTVLRHGKYNGSELGKEEFGYQDKDRENLRTF